MDSPVERISIVVPCVNESALIEATLEAITSLETSRLEEVIIVDGGSEDDTAEKIRTFMEAHSQLPWRFLSCAKRDRGHQMNHGAARAGGELLCFLHADTRPPPELLALIQRRLAVPGTALCGIRSLYEVHGRTHRAITLMSWLKTYVIPFVFFPVLFWRSGFRLLYGDQVMSCRKSLWQELGGFQENVFMEDANFCLRIAREKRGRIALIKSSWARTSGRRRERWGILRTWSTYWGLTLAWALRLPVARWEGRYEEVR